MLYRLMILLFCVMASPFYLVGQDEEKDHFVTEVNKIYPPVSLSMEKMEAANKLIDINKNYEHTWVEKYISVVIMVNQEGVVKKAIGKNDILTAEQKELIKNADTGTNIEVVVKYMPKNDLAHNEVKEMDFMFSIDPETDAKFNRGDQALEEYLKKQTYDKISFVNFKQYQLAVYKFTINAEGIVENPHILWSSEDDEIDKILIDAICNMPVWNPAQYADGTKVNQEFVLRVGDKASCVTNLLNIHQ